MAAKPKKSTAKKPTIAKATTNVTRIKATDTKPEVAVAKSAPKQVKTKIKKETVDKPTPRVLKPLVATAGYFKGAWYELLQVRWPNRKATWSLTAAVLIFSAFFTVLIILLDALFKYLFELILK